MGTAGATMSAAAAGLLTYRRDLNRPSSSCSREQRTRPWHCLACFPGLPPHFPRRIMNVVGSGASELYGPRQKISFDDLLNHAAGIAY